MQTHHARTHAHARTHTRAHTHTRVRARARTHTAVATAVHVSAIQRRPAVTASSAGIHSRGSRVIEINTPLPASISPRCLMFSRIKKLLGRSETRTRDRIYFQTIRTVRDISRADRARIATCSLRTPTDSIDEYGWWWAGSFNQSEVLSYL